MMGMSRTRSGGRTQWVIAATAQRGEVAHARGRSGTQAAADEEMLRAHAHVCPDCTSRASPRKMWPSRPITTPITMRARREGQRNPPARRRLPAEYCRAPPSQEPTAHPAARRSTLRTLPYTFPKRPLPPRRDRHRFRLFRYAPSGIGRSIDSTQQLSRGFPCEPAFDRPPRPPLPRGRRHLRYCCFACSRPFCRRLWRGRRRPTRRSRGVGGRDAGGPRAVPAGDAGRRLEAEHVCTWVPQEVADERLRAPPPQALGPAQAGPAKSAAILAVRATCSSSCGPRAGRAVGRGHRRRAALRAGTGPEDRAGSRRTRRKPRPLWPGRVRDAVARRGRKLEIWSVLAFTHPAAAGRCPLACRCAGLARTCRRRTMTASTRSGTRCRCSSSRGCRFARTRSC